MVELAQPTRRKILEQLLERSESTRSELAELLEDDPDLPDGDTDHFELLLHHNHLQKLDETLFLEYNSRTGDVTRWEDPEVIESRLDDVLIDD